jgi:hypothetical protein
MTLVVIKHPSLAFLVPVVKKRESSVENIAKRRSSSWQCLNGSTTGWGKEVEAKKRSIHEEAATGEIVNRVQGIILS